MVNIESNDNVPDDELDFAEELADTLSDPAFPSLSDPDMNDYVDTLADLYATDYEEDDDEDEDEDA